MFETKLIFNSNKILTKHRKVKKAYKEIETKDKRIAELEKNLSIIKKEERKKMEHKKKERPDSVPSNMMLKVELHEIEPIAINLKFHLMKKKIPFSTLGDVYFSIF